jgi:hypothetical protein
MGQEIVYCFKCLGRLTGADFEKGKGFRHEGQAVCLSCVQTLLESARGTDREALEALLRQVPARKASGPALPTLPARTDSSRKWKKIPPPPPSGRSPSRTRAYLLGAVLATIAAGAILIPVLSSRKEPGPDPVFEVQKAAPPPSPPAALPPPPPPSPSPAPPFGGELEEIDRQVRALTDKEEYGPALDFLAAVRRRYADPAWDRAVAERLGRIEETLGALYAPLREEAIAARRAGDPARVDRVRERVRRWKSDRLREDLEGAIAAAAPKVEAPPPPPPPPSAVPSKDRTLYLKTWERAAGRAALRDFAGALEELQAVSSQVAEPEVRSDLAEDLRLFRTAGELAEKGLQALRNSPRGYNVRINVQDVDGKGKTYDQPLVRATPLYVELCGGIVLTYPEINPLTLAEFSGSPQSEAAAVLCFLEGHPLTARKLWNRSSIPDRYARHAEETKKRRESDSEEQARRFFRTAFQAWLRPSTRVEGLRDLERLKKEFADTLFVSRLFRVFEAIGEESAREYFLGAGDFATGGAMRSRRFEDARSAWTCSGAPTDPAAPTFVEFEFSALAQSPYRAWIYAGACCLEHFSFGLQGTDFPSAAPGSENSISVTPSALLPRLHSAHAARREPARWEWIPLPLLAYPSEGRKKIRLVHLRENFSVAWAFLSSTRSAPPRPSEAREMATFRPPPAWPPEARPPTGRILREYWTGLGGTSVQDLTGNPVFAGAPSGRDEPALFEGPKDWADRYGSRFRGYVWPPVTGNYTFWIAGDDNCELWLSPDYNPARKEKIARVPDFTDPRQWDRDPAQKSKPISLVAGRPYYIEALHKEGVVGDHVAVGWQRPDGILERPIPGERLSPPWPGPWILVAPSPPGDSFPARTNLSIEVDISNVHPARVELFLGSARLTELRPNSLTYRWTNVPAGNHPLLARVTDRSGEVFISPPAAIRVGDLSFHRGINLNGPPCTIDGQTWEGTGAKNLVVRGRGFALPEAELRVPTDADRADMIRSSIRGADASVKLGSVPRGSYLVYLYVWESESSQTYDVLLNGKVVQARHSSGPAGSWDRLGPWPVEVSGDSIEVRVSGGPAHLSGLEVWRVGAGPK